MNIIHGIIHDLGNEETVISGCTTPGEVIIALQGLVEENHLLKRLKRLERKYQNSLLICKTARKNGEVMLMKLF